MGTDVACSRKKTTKIQPIPLHVRSGTDGIMAGLNVLPNGDVDSCSIPEHGNVNRSPPPPWNQMNATIRDRVDSFVADLTQMIREAALEAVQQALGAGGASAARRSAGPGRKPSAAGKGSSAGGRKSPGAAPKGNAAQVAEKLLAEIRRQPGQRLEEIARALKTTTANLRPALDLLLGQGRVRTEGKARGTNYHVGTGTPVRKKAASKKAKKKSGKKKASKKKASKRPATAAGAA